MIILYDKGFDNKIGAFEPYLGFEDKDLLRKYGNELKRDGKTHFLSDLDFGRHRDSV